MQIPKPPQAVTIDCWSTLIQDVDWGQTMLLRRRFLVRIADRYGISLSEDRAAELIESSWQEHVSAWRRGEIYGPTGASRWILSSIGLPTPASDVGAEHLADELAAALEDATTEVGTTVVEGAVEAVDTLRKAGIPTALACDTGFTPARHIRTFLRDHGIVLDHYFFSDEVGSPKPFAPIFQAALDATGASPNQAVHIGDLRRTDIAGARAMGMATIRFTGVHDDGWNTEESQGEEADAVLQRWADLPALLGL